MVCLQLASRAERRSRPSATEKYKNNERVVEAGRQGSDDCGCDRKDTGSFSPVESSWPVHAEVLQLRRLRPHHSLSYYFVTSLRMCQLVAVAAVETETARSWIDPDWTIDYGFDVPAPLAPVAGTKEPWHLQP